jgi:hypothetical protein
VLAAEEIERVKAAYHESEEQLEPKLENADPEKFKRMVKQLFRSSKTER